MKKIILGSLVLILILSSCSTFNTPSLFLDEPLPSWIENPRVRSGRIAYIAEGSGTSEEAARLSAIESVLLELSDDIGWDAYSEYYREMSSTGEVAELDGTIRNSYVREYRGGRFSCYILFDISEDLFISMQSPELVETMRMEEEVRSYMTDARESYMANRDVDAISNALEALSISLDADLKDELSPSEILSTLLYYIEPLEIYAEQETDGIEAKISVKRNRGLLSPLVYSAPIDISYLIRNTEGQIIEEHISFNTGSGVYEYGNTNPYALPEGEVSLSLDLDESLIAEIADKAEDGFFTPFLDNLASKSMSYSYDEKSEGSSLYDILIAQYDIHGAQMDDSTALDAFNSILSDAAGDIVALPAVGDDEEEMIASYLKENSAGRYVVAMRLGVAESIMVDEDRYMVNVHTDTGIYDTRQKAFISTDSSVSSIGYGSSYEDAERDAFLNAGRILADVFLIELE